MTNSKSELNEVFLATMHDSTGPSAHANATSGMLVAASTDGVNFRNVSDNNESLYSPVNGVRDPSVIYWQGQWFMVYNYGPSIEPIVFLLKSSDLLHWEPLGSLRLAPTVPDVGHHPNGINIPQWIVDKEGNIHIFGNVSNNNHSVEIHPLSADPSTWSDQDNWSAVTTITDNNGEPLVLGNAFVALRNGTYYMVFNEVDVSFSKYYMRTSTDLISWSESRLLEIDNSGFGDTSESQNIMFLSDGTLRFYISASNAERNMIWHVDSTDLGVTWESPELLTFSGFAPKNINWAHIARITDPDALKQIANN